MRSRFLFKLFASYVFFVLVNALVAEFLVSRWIARHERVEIFESLAGQAALLADAVRPALGAAADGSLERRIESLAAATGSRLTVVAADGTVLADSAERHESMQNHLARKEFAEAVAKGSGSDERTSVTTGQPTLYYCLAVAGGESRLGFVRVALPLPGIEARLDRLRSTVLAGVLVGTAVALALAVVVARRLTRPVAALTEAAAALATGDLEIEIPVTSRDELGELARAFEHMSARLRERLADLERERSKLAVVLESMTEGVVAVDGDERLLHCNAAARAMLGIGSGAAIGRPLVELVRAPELVAALRVDPRADPHTSSATSEPPHEVRLLQGGRTLVALIRASPLPAGGAVAVLLDATELRRLETVRRDFVANVSHELKTPLAAMRGLVETLVDDEATMDAGVRRRFLGKLGDHVQRLTDLATDLLHLARAEAERPHPPITIDLAAAAATALERLAPAARAKSITLVVSGGAATAVGDPEAIAQILDNLVDNAVKYTPAGGRVEVRTLVADEGGAPGAAGVIEVIDNGVGIEPVEQARVFERFYRVDKARARDVPGTGLGLSIVKHLVEAHGGTVTLESWPGRGSTFRVRLPGRPAGQEE